VLLGHCFDAGVEDAQRLENAPIPHRRFGRIAQLVGIDIAVVDMPFVFLLQWDVVARNPDVAAPAVWTASETAGVINLDLRRVASVG